MTLEPFDNLEFMYPMYGKDSDTNKTLPGTETPRLDFSIDFMVKGDHLSHRGYVTNKPGRGNGKDTYVFPTTGHEHYIFVSNTPGQPDRYFQSSEVTSWCYNVGDRSGTKVIGRASTVDPYNLGGMAALFVSYMALVLKGHSNDLSIESTTARHEGHTSQDRFWVTTIQITHNGVLTKVILTEDPSTPFIEVELWENGTGSKGNYHFSKAHDLAVQIFAAVYEEPYSFPV